MTGPVPAAVRVLRALTWAGVYGGLLMPLAFSAELVVYPFVFLKLLYLQALIGLTFPAWAALAWLDPRFRPRRSWVALALLAHLAALALSVAFAADRSRAFWGNQERMNGLFSLLHYAAWFLMTASSLRGWPAWRRLLRFQAALGVAMAAVALLQLPFPLLLGLPSDVRVAGLLGNPIYSASYHLFCIFLLAFLRAQEPSPRLRALWLAAALPSLAAMWAAGSRGPLLALAVGATAAALAWGAVTGRRRALALSLGALAASVAGYVLVARALVPLPALRGFWQRVPSLLHVFTLDFDPTRRRLWGIAVDGFRERPWTGWGLANFEAVFDVFYPPIALCEGPEGTLQDSAHSVFFDHLAASGAPGLLTFLVLWGAVFAALAGALRRGALAPAPGAALAGLAAGYLAQGLFVFDSPGLTLMSTLLLGLAAAAATGDLQAPAGPPPVEAPLRPTVLAAFAVAEALACALVWRTTVQPALASRLNKATHQAFRRGSCDEMLTAAQGAFAVPTPYLDDQLYTLSRDLGSLAARGQLNRCTQWRPLVAHTRRVAERLLADHPSHAHQRSAWAGLLLAAGRAGPAPELLDEAGPHLARRLEEAPRRQLAHFDQANWLVAKGRVPEAHQLLLEALRLDESIGDVRWQLGVFTWRTLQLPKQGAELLAGAVTGRCARRLRGALEVQQLAQAWALLGDRERLRTIVQHVKDLPKEDRPAAAHLAVARALEAAGLVAERDQVLAIGEERHPALAMLLAPLSDGRAHTLAEAERMMRATSTPR